MATKSKGKKKYKYKYNAPLEEPKEEDLPWHDFKVVLLTPAKEVETYILPARTIGRAWSEAEANLREGYKVLRINRVL